MIESKQMENALTSDILHDIKNYAAGIEGNIALLSRQYPSDPRISKTARLVSDCCRGILSLSANVLDIGKFEDHKISLEKEKFSVKRFFDLLDDFRGKSMFEEKNISFKFLDNTNGLLVIEADPYLLERIMENLFRNAARYVPRNGNVALTLESGNDENIICLFNSGLPVPDADREIIFDKYSSLESKGSPYSKGQGLFFCKLALSAHDGRIWLETDQNGNYFKIAFKKTKDT